MKTRLNWFLLGRAALVGVSLTLAGISHAAPHPPPRPPPRPPPPSTESEKLQANADIDAEAGHLNEAVDGWRKAWTLSPTDPLVACNIGRAELRRGLLREAAIWLTRCVHLLPKGTTPDGVEFGKQCAVELLTARQKLSALVIELEEPDTRVVIDDSDVRITPLREDVFVNPGEHRIDAYNGLRIASKTLSTVAGKEYRVALALPPVVPVSFVPPAAPLAVVPPNLPPSWWVRSTLPPPPETFRWWPVAVGGALVGTGLGMGMGLFVAGNSASDNAALTLATIQGEGKTCSKTTAENDPRCGVYERFNSRSADYSTGAIASFIAAGAITAGIIGYAIYENRRVTIATTVSGVTGKYQW